MLAADAEDPVAHYLAGRLRREDRDRQQHFAAAVQAAPRSLWPWFGLAHSLRDADVARSLAIYGALYLAADKHPLVGVSYAAVLLRAKQVEAAAAVYRDLQADERVP